MDFGTFVAVFALVVVLLAAGMATASPTRVLPGGAPAFYLGAPAARAVAGAMGHPLVAPIVPGVPAVAPPPAGPGPDPTSVVPPLFLYHGTRFDNLDSIARLGIQGRSGGWAFMADAYDTAISYGRGKGGETVVFRIRAQQAYQDGVAFSKRNGYFVAAALHPGYVDFAWALADRARRAGE